VNVEISIISDEGDWRRSVERQEIHRGSQKSTRQIISLLDQVWQEVRTALLSQMTDEEQEGVPVALLVSTQEAREFMNWSKSQRSEDHAL
jgi:hypothetical protein